MATSIEGDNDPSEPPGSGRPDRMQIFIRTPAGTTITLEVEPAGVVRHDHHHG